MKKIEKILLLVLVTFLPCFQTTLMADEPEEIPIKKGTVFVPNSSPKSIPSSNTKEYEPYDLSLTLDKRFLFKNGKFAPFTLHDLIQINYSYHYECYSISELSDEYGISFDVIKRILSRYQKGDFDKFINDEYFKDMNEGELKNHYSRFEDFLKGKSADFTSLTMKGYSIAKSCEISNLDIDEVESWLLKGEKGLKPYDIFYDAFLESKEQLLDEKAPFLIENIESGHSLAKASQMADLSINEVKMWIEKGHGKIEPYADFYKDYSNALKAVNKKRIENFLKLIKEGRELNVAAIQSGLDVGDVKNWIKKGKEDLSPYNQFYKEYVRSRQDHIKDKLNLFLLKTEEGKAINQSAFEAGLDDEDVRTWLKYGEEGKEPYIEFYQDYKEALDK